MQRFLGLVLLFAISLPALADEPAKIEAPPAKHARVTWEQHFNQANTGHDGHLTAGEAKAGYPLVAKHFDDIDVDHKGYVTADDFRAWRIMRKTASRLAKPPEDKLRPRSAVQHVFPNVRPNPARGRQALTTSDGTAPAV